jgi:hypothetical protein
MAYVLFDERTKQLPNPFSGFSKIFGQPNTNKSDQLFDRDALQGVGYISSKGDTILNRSAFGGNKTSFKCDGNCPEDGFEILSLSTNPSPVPLMTYTSGDNFMSARKMDINKNSPYENRTVYLNGLNISILKNNYEKDKFGDGAIKIKIRWNDYEVKKDVRWCADSIRLCPNDFDTSAYSLTVKKNVSVWIDRGKSPTYDYIDKIRNDFTAPTVFSSLENSKILVEEKGKLIIDNGSSFEIENNSGIDLLSGARIIVKNGSVIHLKAGSKINLSRRSKIVFESGGKIIKDDGSVIKKNWKLVK